MSNVQRVVGHSSVQSSGRKNKASRKNEADVDVTVDPLESLHSRQKHEEFSCRDCIVTGIVITLLYKSS